MTRVYRRVVIMKSTTTCVSGVILFLTTFGVITAPVHTKPLRYQAPGECKWYSVGAAGEQEVASANIVDNQEVALVCQLPTINSDFEKTNFSVIQPQNTVKLKIVCGRKVFYKSNIGVGSFQTLIDVRDLSIEFCKIDNVTQGAFRGLRQLRNLTFTTHNEEWSGMSLHISQDAFADELHQLERLDFGSNNVKNLANGVFCSLPSLAFLNLTHNRIHDLESLNFGSSASGGTSDDFPKCGGKIRVLDLSNNSVDTVTQKVFAKLSQLEELHLQENVLTGIADHAFDNLTSLSVINLSNNKLVLLPPELFVDARQLKEIHLQNNSLNTLAPGLFHGLNKLILLDLSDNDLTEEWINTATFTGLTTLFMLNLSGNKLTKLESFMFRDLVQLRILRLENNLIQIVPENTFASLTELTSLIMSNNKLTRLESFSFDGLSGLSLLALDNNQITYIGDNSFRNSSLLEDLHLNQNELREIPIALKNVLNLRTLDLGTNQITSLQSNSFPPMTQLVGLRLAENRITNVTRGVFDQLTELQIINLSSNKIETIEKGTFDSNQKVVAIRIDSNCLKEVSELFSKLPNLVWLNISENFLQWFDYALIPTGLQWLDIHGNHITELANHFEIESNLQLTVFDASNNHLTKITGSSIPNAIQSLNLANNNISEIQSYAFFKKNNLTSVNLTGNQLRTILPHSFRIAIAPLDKSLPQFLISNNPIQCDCSMQWLKVYSVEPERNKPIIADLDDVRCELLYNREQTHVLIREATTDQFLCRYELECAKRSMCDCCDFEACDCKMVCPSRCTCYHSMSASANVVSCTRASYVNEIPDKIPMNVTQLYLDGNDIRVLSSHILLGRRMLKVLYLNNSNIEVVQNRTFSGLKELEVLRLEHNRISTLKGNEFEGLDRLKELYLHHNRISSIQMNTFITLYSLSVMRLDRNHLSQFAVWKLPSSLNSVTLSENPWTCECAFVQRLQEFVQIQRSIIVDDRDIKCLNSSFRHSFPILSDNITEFCQQQQQLNEQTVHSSHEGNTIGEGGAWNSGSHFNNGVQNASSENSVDTSNGGESSKFLTPTNILVLIIIFLILACLLTVLGCMYRDELRIWFHSKFGVRLFYPTSEIEMDDRDKLFDAFVSYSAKDEIFVAEELAPILENGDPSYKLCLHYREFPIGGYLSDTIVQAVESSRRTIMVLSENFLKSEWSRYEFKSAHHQVLRDRRKRLIVILLGNVSLRDLDPDLRAFLKNNTYLQWGEKLFWDRLRFALPDVPNNQRHKNNRHRHAHHHINAHSHSGIHLQQQHPHLNPHHHQQHHSLHRQHSHGHGRNHHTGGGAPNNRSMAIHI